MRIDDCDLSQAVEQYFEYWKTIDQSSHTVLSETSSVDADANCLALESLRKIASEYKIARTLPLTIKEEPAQRLSLALASLLAFPLPIGREAACKSVRDYTKQLYGHYGRLALSAASKFLWMRFRYPVIIYDDLVYRYLRQRDRTVDLGYDCFVDVWLAEYQTNEGAILQACKRFHEERGGADQNIVSEGWFRERVFDFAMLNRMQKS